MFNLPPKNEVSLMNMLKKKDILEDMKEIRDPGLKKKREMLNVRCKTKKQNGKKDQITGNISK
jgi:hypothetical protein